MRDPKHVQTGRYTDLCRESRDSIPQRWRKGAENEEGRQEGRVGRKEEGVREEGGGRAGEGRGREEEDKPGSVSTEMPRLKDTAGLCHKH